MANAFVRRSESHQWVGRFAPPHYCCADPSPLNRACFRRAIQHRLKNHHAELGKSRLASFLHYH
jgi:hypothetical protein